jgi:branched-subunit amino acid transport protein
MKPEILWLLFGMAVVTFLPRFIPMAFLTRMAIPEKVKIGLDYIPAAILSAIIFPILFSTDQRKVGVDPHFILAAVPVFIFAYKMKNLWGSVIVGMLVYWGLGIVFGS